MDDIICAKCREVHDYIHQKTGYRSYWIIIIGAYTDVLDEFANHNICKPTCRQYCIDMHKYSYTNATMYAEKMHNLRITVLHLLEFSLRGVWRRGQHDKHFNWLVDKTIELFMRWISFNSRGHRGYVQWPKTLRSNGVRVQILIKCKTNLMDYTR